MEKMHYLILPIGFLFLSFLPTFLGIITVRNITTDQYALLALKNHILSDSYTILSRNWSITSSVCDWIGVTCGSRHHRVTALNISYMGLSGTIPPQLGNLSFLVSLDFTGNNFYRELPNEISHLRRLKVLEFSINNLSGKMSSWLGSLYQLQFLSLSNNTFTGSIPTSISNLSNLEHLMLSFNSFHGSIPKGIGNLHNLKTLAISHNRITGPIPYEIFNLSSLETFVLKNNSLSGRLPMSICYRLGKLRILNLSFNKLNGQIPYGLSQCSQLQMLSLSFNEFGGFIPKEIGSLKVLEKLYLGNNNLEGEIPPEIGNLTMLSILSIRESSLSGVIPMEFGNLYNLQALYLENDSLSGPIATKIFNLSTIRLIDLTLNNLSGNLPSDMCRVPNLEVLYLDVNDLHGPLSESISNCSNLNIVELSKNNFVGFIPKSLGNLRLLEVLNLGDNHFTSYFPSLEHGFINSLTNCKYLRKLGVNDNPLNGHLSESVGNLSTSLEMFYAHNCSIKGKIPQGFGNLSSLIVLTLRENQLMGSIPETIKDLQYLQALDLGNNELNGAMMDKLCGLPSLAFLVLSQNHISGSIPECLGNITHLRNLYLDSNRLTSAIPTNLLNLKYLMELNLSSNSLSGFLPLEVGNFKVAISLDLSVNNLYGGIPITIGGLQDMKYLSLAFNGFQGSIPELMDKMVSLETLDLSHNYLTGLIPISFEKLQSLTHLNVSFNNLRGRIPNEGPFENFTSESFMSNDGLCGPQRFHVPPCPIMSNQKSGSKNALRTALICVGIASSLGLLAFGLVYLRCRKKKIDSSGDGMSLLGGHERISYYELLQATNRYNETNLLGIGGFGSVYHGTLEDGRTIAIKVFNSELERAFKSFEAECRVLQNLRHRNLTKVISSCSTPDFRALVLEFMPNGSLDKWLYSNNCTLDLKQRLNIMIDVANALQYLHCGYSTPVVHCDLKPSNVLLDQEMVAHVSDFGIAKMLNKEHSFTHTTTIATLGYVAPEYGLEGLVSTKCDVYSYGIMLMEVFTRIRPSDERFNDNFSLQDIVRNAMPDALYEVVDASLLQNGEKHNAEKLKCISSIMEIALTCSRESSKERSNMDQVVNVLNNVKTKLISL